MKPAVYGPLIAPTFEESAVNAQITDVVCAALDAVDSEHRRCNYSAAIARLDRAREWLVRGQAQRGEYAVSLLVLHPDIASDSLLQDYGIIDLSEAELEEIVQKANLLIAATRGADFGNA